MPHGTLVSLSSAPVLQKPPWPSGWIVTLGDSAALLPSIIGLFILTYPSELSSHLDLGCSSDSGAASAFPSDPGERAAGSSATEYRRHCPQTRSYGPADPRTDAGWTDAGLNGSYGSSRPAGTSECAHLQHFVPARSSRRAEARWGWAVGPRPLPFVATSRPSLAHLPLSRVPGVLPSLSSNWKPGDLSGIPQRANFSSRATSSTSSTPSSPVRRPAPASRYLVWISLLHLGCWLRLPPQFDITAKRLS